MFRRPLTVGIRKREDAHQEVAGLFRFVGFAQGLAKLVLRFDALVLEDGTRVPITATLSSVAPSTKKRDAATIAGGAAAGALLGKLFGKHGKDALVGAIAGGAIGTGVVLGTKGKEVEMKEGTELSIQLQKPANIPVT